MDRVDSHSSVGPDDPMYECLAPVVDMADVMEHSQAETGGAGDLGG